MSNYVIGGIEGGATHSHIILFNQHGKQLAFARGEGTNLHLLGMQECRKRIVDLVNLAKDQASIDKNTPLSGLGLSLSGCEKSETNDELVAGLERDYPDLSEQYAIGSDTEGSIAATSNKGGVTCIAGTGSNTLLINPDGQRIQCGGWGYLIGDEGSAWKIAHMAIKTCFDVMDNLTSSPYTIDKVWALVQDHFQIKTQPDMLEYFYMNFDKARIASLCKKLSDLAAEGDKLSLHIFEEAGHQLAAGIAAVYPKAAKELTERPGGIHILCVGSVWLSWKLLEKGFVDHLQTTSIPDLSLMKLITNHGTGAALMAADRLKLPLKRDYSENYSIFYTYIKQSKSCNGKP